MKHLPLYFFFACTAVAFWAQPALAKDGDIEICGVIESIDSQQVTLNGVSYQLDSGTEYEGPNDEPLSLEDFAVGLLIEMRIRDGRVDQLEIEDENDCSGSSSSSDDDSDDGSDDDSDDSSDDDSDDDSSGKDEDRERICGRITALTSDSITVNSQTYAVTSGTEFESEDDTPLTFSAFNIDDFVKLDIRNGALHEVEMERSSDCRSERITQTNRRRDQNRSTLRRKRLRTRLVADEGVTTSGRGWARYQERAKKGKFQSRFKAKVLIPLPSSTPNVPGASEATALQLLAIIQRGTDTIAICTLEFDEIEDGTAEYKLDVRLKEKSSVRFEAKKGGCDIDPAQPGIQNSVPSIQSGDDIVVVPADLSAFLTGNF